MIVGRIVAAFLMLSVNAAAINEKHPYRRDWRRTTYSKRSLVNSAAGSGVSHAVHHSKVYGHGAAGLGKHLGMGLATHAVASTVEHGIAARLHEDLHYHRSHRKGFRPRLTHALLSTVVTRNTHTHRHRPAVGRVSGHAAAGAFSQAVLPATSGAATAGFGLAAVAGTNVAREFWPTRHRVKHQ